MKPRCDDCKYLKKLPEGSVATQSGVYVPTGYYCSHPDVVDKSVWWPIIEEEGHLTCAVCPIHEREVEEEVNRFKSTEFDSEEERMKAYYDLSDDAFEIVSDWMDVEKRLKKHNEWLEDIRKRWKE